jgi:hypothetical protein
MSTIYEIASKLERLANEIAAINMRPFGDRIDLRQDEVDAVIIEDADESKSSIGHLDS